MAGPRDSYTEAFMQYLLTDRTAPADVTADSLFDPKRRQPPADQAAFLRSEKDTRPYDDTWQRHTFLPVGVNGYNNTPPGRSYGPAQPGRDTFPSLSMPGMIHDTVEGFNHFGDMIRGNQPVSYLDETGRERPTPEAMGSVNALVGATMVGGGATAKGGGYAVKPMEALSHDAFPSLPPPVPVASRFADRETFRREGGAAGVVANTGRTLDPLGYYSKLDEVLGAFRPTDTVTAQTLAQRGVKASELQARGLDGLLERGGVKVQDLIAKASEPVRLNESVYWGGKKNQGNLGLGEYNAMTNDDLLAALERPSTTPPTTGANGPAKWRDYSLDKGSNPTYRETVLSLPLKDKANMVSRRAELTAERSRIESAFDGPRGEPSETQIARLTAIGKELHGLTNRLEGEFSSSHWSEPNVIAHMRTSMQKDSAGRPVFHIDELQSDWGQKIRDGGVRDEAKIADLSKALDDAIKAKDEAWQKGKHNGSGAMQDVLEPFRQRERLALAEYENAQASSPGHPLVNISDQWQTTALRRALRQATEANADAVAIPSGNTVHRYGMGTEGGAASQEGVKYAYDKMYPNVIGKELAKLDPSIKRQLETLLGHEDKGPFSYFPLTDTAKQKIREGLPLFSNADTKAGSIASLPQSDRDALRRIMERFGVQ